MEPLIMTIRNNYPLQEYIRNTNTQYNDLTLFCVPGYNYKTADLTNASTEAQPVSRFVRFLPTLVFTFCCRYTSIINTDH